MCRSGQQWCLFPFISLILLTGKRRDSPGYDIFLVDIYSYLCQVVSWLTEQERESTKELIESL